MPRRRTSWGSHIPFRLDRRRLAAALVAAVMVVAAPGALAAAQTRIGLNGGRPSEWPILSDALAGQGLTQEGWLAFASHVGENWLPGTTPVALDYPAQLGLVSGPGALTADQSTAMGQQLLHALILSELAKGQGQPLAVAGLSEGTLVIERELAYLQSLPEDEAPLRDALTFYVFGDMARGLGQMYLSGVTIPLIGQTFVPVPESRYDTVVVNEQWDGWANPPDRPWNLLADLNAVMGAVYTANGSNDHSQTSLDSLSDAVLTSQITNSVGGTTTTYIVPRQQLPITRPLLQLGVPRWVVDEIDKLLMPLIRAGYSSLTPNLGPRIERGQLVFTPPSAPVVQPMATVPRADVTPVQTGTASADPSSKSLSARTSPVASSADQAARSHLNQPASQESAAPAASVESPSGETPSEATGVPPSTGVPAGSASSGELGNPADGVDQVASIKDDTETSDEHQAPRPRLPADSNPSTTSVSDDAEPVEHRGRPTLVRPAAGTDDSTAVHEQAKSTGAADGAAA